MEESGADSDTHFETRAAITSFLFLRDEPAPVDFCFVLGCPDASTMRPAVDLYTKKFTSKLIISGHGPTPQSPPECEVFKEYAIGHGVPESAISLEQRASNTLENFIFSRRIIASEVGWPNTCSAAIVGKPFHMRRALMTARMHWPADLRLLMLPAASSEEETADGWWKSAKGRSYVFSELEAIGRYAMLGHIGGY
jgi:hypothetical protein